jgi:plasmid stabilization system protein ParE
MPRGDKSAYTDKQKRQAAHIEESYEARGVSPHTAAARAWATVNKEDGGGNQSGSGRGHPKRPSAGSSAQAKTRAGKKHRKRASAD